MSVGNPIIGEECEICGHENWVFPTTCDECGKVENDPREWIDVEWGDWRKESNGEANFCSYRCVAKWATRQVQG